MLGGRYRIVRSLADGTFSRIALVEDTICPHWRRRIAVKVLGAGFGAIGRREAAILALLQGCAGAPIPRLYGAFESGPHYCVAMEAFGPPLGEAIARGPAAEAALRSVAAQLLGALACLRKVEIIHADIKPDNVLLEDGGIKLIDFGNAIRPREALRYFDDFEIQTPGYRAPEVLVGVRFSFPIDVFSAGVVLVEFATGRALLRPKSGRVDRAAARAVVEAVLGDLPDERFAGAKFRPQNNDRPPLDEPTRRRSYLFKVKKRLPRRMGVFAAFAADLLELDPDHRSGPRAALMHPFLAPTFPFATVFGPGRPD